MMAGIEEVLNVIYYIIMVPVFFMGLNLARKGLVKVNKIEGERFRATDWLVSAMFGLLFTVAIVFCINLAVDFFLTPDVGITIPPVGSYLLVIALGVLLVYPFWEMFYLARPSSDSVTGYHRFLEAKFINRVRGRGAYLVSLLLLFMTYGIPIALIASPIEFSIAQAGFLWITIVPLVFLNYFAASGTVGNFIKVMYTTQASNRAYPGIKKFQNLITNMMGLIKLVIAIVPLILAAYGLYSSISAAIEGGASEAKTGTSAYLSLFTTVVFGIMGFFSRFWNKKSKTKSIDFIFSGYIMIAIMMNILINFMTLDASQVLSQFNGSIPIIGPFLVDIKLMLENPVNTLPIITLQNIITITYAAIIIFQKNSDFQANIRLGAVIGSYQMASEKNLVKLKKAEEKSEKKGAQKGAGDAGRLEPKLKVKPPDLVVLLKSIILEPGFNKYGIDVNEPVRAKARQYLSLFANQKRTKPATIAKIVEYLQKHTVGKVRSAKRSFLSPEAFICLGEIGKTHPDTVLDPLLDNLAGKDLLKRRYILNALGLMGGQTGKVKEIIQKEDVRAALKDESYEVKNAAILSIVDIGLELNDVVPVLEELYLMLGDTIKEALPQSEHFVETLLESIVKLSLKQPDSVDIDKISIALDYKPAYADNDALDYILQNTLRIIAYLAHYHPDRVPVERIAEYARSDKREFIRYMACDVLGNLVLVKPLPDVIQLLVKKSLEDPDDDVRAMCNESITEYCIHTTGESECVLIDGKQVGLLEYYLAKLDDPDRFTAENASEALKSLAREFSADIS
ncbi:MAG: HEAT repeat domain-containing protein, partial [Candidatus Lokiarchaeota archaeon]|nr:HEAT repeat domain-containing protein [Candidatus Lokiarchaeota archaeon]